MIIVHHGWDFMKCFACKVGLFKALEVHEKRLDRVFLICYTSCRIKNVGRILVMAGLWDNLMKRLVGANPEHFINWLIGKEV